MSHPRPRVLLDHVLIAIKDLGEGARQFAAQYGLQALEGGRHPGVGTANMIVPLRSAYLELISVVDAGEAARSPSGNRITQTIAEGRTFATWAVRTDNLDLLREYFRESGRALPEPHLGARQRPDGVTLRWRTQFLAPMELPGVLPFVIEWSVPQGMHPAEAPVHHPSRARGIRLVRLGDPSPPTASEQIRALLGEDIPVVVEEADTSGVVAVEIDAPDGVIVVR
jgi:hypothetical protein